MNKLAVMFLAVLALLAATSSDAYTTKRVYKSLRQQKVCLTSIGWCSDFSKRTADLTSCFCRNHQQNPGHVTTLSVTLSTVPQID